MWRARNRVAASCGAGTILMLLVAALAVPSPAAAEGAYAVGVPKDVANDGLAYGRNVGSATKEIAAEQALKICRNAPDSSAQAQHLCAVVATFHGLCLAAALDPAPNTPGWGAAVGATQAGAAAGAMADCVATAGADRQAFCKVMDAVCDAP
jgi:hypothetical protein